MGYLVPTYTNLKYFVTVTFGWHDSISFTKPSDRLYYYIIASSCVCLGIRVLPIYTYRTIERNGAHPPSAVLINRNFSKREMSATILKP